MSANLQIYDGAERPPWLKAGMSRERYLELRQIGDDPDLGYRVLLQGMCFETLRYLETLARGVREGKNVDEAANFCRWLQFSGVLELLERYAMPGQDFHSVRRMVSDVILECGERFRGGRVQPTYSESDIAAINRKLDVLLSQAAHAPSGLQRGVLAVFDAQGPALGNRLTPARDEPA